MNFRKVFPILCLSLMFLPQRGSCSDDRVPIDTLMQGLGFSAGFVGGLGFSYRYLPPEGLGLHTAFIFLSTESSTFFNLAAEPIFVLHRGEQSTLYILGGISLFGSDSETTTAGGVGLGYGYLSRGRIWSSFDLVMTAHKGAFLPYPQMAVHYMFW